MKQEIVIDVPPNFAELLRIFPEARQVGVIFSYGDKIYNPSGLPIPPQLLAHEAVHGERQLAYTLSECDSTQENNHSTEQWWKRYCEDVKFRFEEELVAHVAEVKAFNTTVPKPDRERRALYLHRVAQRLSGPLYGRMITYMEARRKLQACNNGSS